MLKKKRFSLMMALLLFVMMLAPAFVAVQQADAADEEWIDVSTPADLDTIRSGPTKNYRLTQDIDLSSYTSNWDPIGSYPGSPFTGKFDGQGHTISHLQIISNANNVGMFAYTWGANIANVHLTNVNVSGAGSVGGLVGNLENSVVTGISVSGAITGNELVGGLTGYSNSSTVRNSYTTGNVVGGATPNAQFGGITGYATFPGSASNEFRNVYSNAQVYAGTDSGGLIGLADGYLRIYNAYWDAETSGRTTSSGGGTGLGKEAMLSKDTFAGWDFTNTWGIVEGVTYPLSRSQYESIALAALTVNNEADGTTITLDRPFSSDYGVYNAQVVRQIDHLDISGAAISGTSSVSINGSGSLQTIALAPGANNITIRVTATTGLTADYKLTVTQDEGTELNPHRITTAAQLADIGNSAVGYDLSQAYRLDADLNLSGYTLGDGWLPIGNDASPFTGIFDGNHHTIANLTINRPGTDDIGLFGRTDSAQVTDLAVTNVNLTGHNNVGGLIGTSVDTIVSSTAVHGEVHGNDKVAGLIGSQSTGTVDYSYSAAHVDAPVGSTSGGLVADSSGGTVTRSFWDTQKSQQVQSSGGGTGKTTNELKSRATYTADGWLFGSGHSWDMIEGTGYPMPLSSFANVTLSSFTLSTLGATHTLSSFDALAGVYEATVSTPVTTAEITATPAATGASVTFNGLASGSLNLHLGSNLVDVLVTSPDGLSQGLYRLTLTVPTPQVQSVQPPPDGMYGIGQQLDFTVAFDHPIDVTDTPTLPIDLDGIASAALYVGQPVGHPSQLTFTYTVQAGDLDSDGIALGSTLAAAAPAAITAIGESVSMTLAGVPSLSSVLIDGIAPTIDLTPSTTAATIGPLIVNVTADGTGSALSVLKWAAGMHAGSYFTSGGTDVASHAFQVTDNGTYTVFARDGAGNTAVSTISISNLITQNPSVALDYNPKSPTRSGVDVSAVVSVDNSAGNALHVLKWAMGSHAASDLADPAFGTDITATASFHASANGTYTVYAEDLAGNKKAETITIGNIVTQLPTIVLDYTPKTSQSTKVNITVTAAVYEEGTGNTLASLRWAPGDLTVGNFADPSFGTTVSMSGLIPVTKNGKYTVYAADAAGNEQVASIAITTIAAPSTSDSDSNVNVPPSLRLLDGQFQVVPGQAYTLTFDSLALHIPAAAITQTMIISMTNATSDAQKLLGTDQVLLSDAFSLTKNVPGTFAAPLTLTLQGSASSVAAGAHVALFYYDESVKQWQQLPSKSEGTTISGQTDHFTLFAALPLQVSVESSFTDIAGHWAEQDIRSSAAQGWVSGYPNGAFLPNKAVTRAEFAVMLNNVLHWPAAQNLSFTDESTIPNWAAASIAAAAQAGILSGYEDRSFRPNVNITREEAAAMIVRATGLPALPTAATGFADDADIANWAKGWISAAAEANLVQGQGNNVFHPQASTTRAEAVVLLQRLAAALQ